MVDNAADYAIVRCTKQEHLHFSQMGGENMLKLAVTAVAFGLLSGSVAFAQNFTGSCEQFCREKRCAPTNVNYGVGVCMSKCVPACRQKNPKAK